MHWETLSTTEQVYWIIACAASVVLCVQTVLAFMTGIDLHPGDIHTGSDLGAHGGDSHHGDAGINFQLLTIRNVVAFFTLLGWSGLAFYHMRLPLFLVFGLSFLCGFAMMMITAILFYLLSILQSDGTLEVAKAKGEKGKVYLQVPPSRQGEGKIQVTLQGRIVELNAVTDDTVKIEFDSMVEIMDMVQNQALVKKI